MLCTGSSSLPEGGIGVMDGGRLEDMAGLCTTGLSVAVAVVVEGREGGVPLPFAGDR